MGYIRIRKEEPPAGITWASPTALYTDTGDEIERVIYNGNTIWGTSSGGWSKTESWTGSGSLVTGVYARTNAGQVFPSSGTITYYTFGLSNSSGSTSSYQALSSITLRNPFSFTIRVTIAIDTHYTRAGPAGSVTRTIEANSTASLNASAFKQANGTTISSTAASSFSWTPTTSGGLPSGNGSPPGFTFTVTGINNEAYSITGASCTTPSWPRPTGVSNTSYTWSPSLSASGQHTTNAADPYVRVTKGTSPLQAYVTGTISSVGAESTIVNYRYSSTDANRWPTLSWNTDGASWQNNPTVSIQLYSRFVGQVSVNAQGHLLTVPFRDDETQHHESVTKTYTLSGTSGSVSLYTLFGSSTTTTSYVFGSPYPIQGMDGTVYTYFVITFPPYTTVANAIAREVSNSNISLRGSDSSSSATIGIVVLSYTGSDALVTYSGPSAEVFRNIRIQSA